MFFMLKKAVGNVLLPLPFLLLLMAVGILLLWFSRWQKSGKIIISTSWLVLLLISLQPVADRLLLPVESHYPTWNGSQKVDYIVVLGGGYTYNSAWAPSSNLLNNSLPRVTEGVRQWRRNPQATMIFTGAAAGHNPKSNAWVAAQVAESLGVPSSHIHTLDQPKDTAQEAQAVSALIGHQPFLLVTSANHMPRAMRFSSRQDSTRRPRRLTNWRLPPVKLVGACFPSPLWMGHSERAIYETLGSLLQRFKTSAEDTGP